MPYDHAEIAVVDSFDGSRRGLANVGYPDDMLTHFHGPQFEEEIRSLNMHVTGYPVRTRDSPATASRCTLSLRSSCRPATAEAYHAPAHLVRARNRPAEPVHVRRPDPSDTERDVVSALCSTLANVADATQSARFLLSLLEPGAFAIALSRDGASRPWPASRRIHSWTPAPISPASRTPSRRATAGTAPASCGPPTIAAGTGSASPRAGRRAWPGVRRLFAHPETIAIDLTRRELEVLTMLTSGRSNAEIGSRLWISPRTVGTYVESAPAKLDAPTGAAAAARAVADGMIVPLEAFTDDAAGKRAP